MKTIVCSQPGLLAYEERQRPVITPGNALIKIKRIGICGTDLHAYEGTQPYFSYPRILGHELSGELVEIDNDSQFKEGEAVTFLPYFNCGTCIACRSGRSNCCSQLKVAGVHIDGGMVEYLSVPESNLVKGEGLSYEELAMVEPLAIGAHGVQRAGITEGDFVLVMGAGPIGLGTMEFARIAGGNVIALDINDNRLAFCKNNLLVSHTINAIGDDVTSRLMEITKGDMPAVVIDATGSLPAINNAFQYLSHGGKFVLIGLQKGNISFSHPEFHKREATVMSSRNACKNDFEQVIECIQKGLINPTNYITHQLFFDQVRDQFAGWLIPDNGVIKAMVEIN